MNAGLCAFDHYKISLIK